MRSSVGGFGLDLLLSASLQAIRPSACGMFVYNVLTSADTSTAPVGKELDELTLLMKLMKSVVSCK